MQTENIWKAFPNSYSNLTLKLLFPTFIWIRIWNFFFDFLIKKEFGDNVSNWIQIRKKNLQFELE